jgi:hypothetical protein
MNSIKPLSELTIKDILESSVWEYWLENETEFVKATNKTEISELDSKRYIVLTDFELQNKLKYLGFCSPMDTSGLDYIQPVIISEKGQINFWMDFGWNIKQKEIELAKLGLNQKMAFPIIYKSRIAVDGLFYEGIITDFNKGR